MQIDAINLRMVRKKAPNLTHSKCGNARHRLAFAWQTIAIGWSLEPQKAESTTQMKENR